MSKTRRFLLFIRKTKSKTFRADGFRKCLESETVLCFLLSVVYDVLLHLQYFIEEIKPCSGVLLLTQLFFFVRLFNLFILWMCNKALNVWSLGKLVSFPSILETLGKIKLTVSLGTRHYRFASANRLTGK